MSIIESIYHIEEAKFGIDMQAEAKTLSDGALSVLAYEEEVSDELRAILMAELQSRPESFVILTSNMLHEAGTSGYMGWNRKQLAALGIQWPPPKRWLKSLEGKKITRDAWNRFLAARKHNQNQPR
jgi:hypothetical protein